MKSGDYLIVPHHHLFARVTAGQPGAALSLLAFPFIQEILKGSAEDRTSWPPFIDGALP